MTCEYVSDLIMLWHVNVVNQKKKLKKKYIIFCGHVPYTNFEKAFTSFLMLYLFVTIM